MLRLGQSVPAALEERDVEVRDLSIPAENSTKPLPTRRINIPRS